MSWIMLSLKSVGRISSIVPRRLEQFSANYSVYAPFYVEPKFRKEEIDALLETPEGVKLKEVPFKAAQTEDTCSVFYDDDTREFIDYLQRGGNRVLARYLVFEAFKYVKIIQLGKYHEAPPGKRDDIELNPTKIFKKALKNCKPVMSLSRFTKGGQTYQIPGAISARRARFNTFRWLATAGQEKPDKISFEEQLAQEIINAYNCTGKVYQKKVDLHRQCEANRAYAHYRWR